MTETPWRTQLWHAGRQVGRTIYQGDGPDDLIGILDSRELAAHVVALHNAAVAAGASERLEHDYVWVCPGRLSGEPCIGGHRLATLQMAEALWYRADTPECTMDSYELTRGQLLVAAWYAATYGTWTWRKRWGGWAADHMTALWHADYAAVPWPPSLEKI